MAGIVESQKRQTVAVGDVIKELCLGAMHVRTPTAEPDKTGPFAFAFQEGDAFSVEFEKCRIRQENIPSLHS